MVKGLKIARELARGARLLRDGGPSAGWGFLREEVLANTWTRLRAASSPPAASWVECNLCGWRGPRFLTHFAQGYVDRNAFCPSCKSYPRHRGFAWLLEHELGAELARADAVPGRRVLFAPEPGMLRLLSGYVSGIEGADLDPRRELVQHVEDLQALTFPDRSVAFACCFHVLEHVPRDRQALAELRRVLHPEGRLVLCVPMTLGRRETIEFPRPDPLLNGHCFDYGEDFVERLTEAGFSGTAYRLHERVPRELHERLALTADVVYLLRGTAAGERPAVA